MDDEEEVQQINLSSRPLREEQRRQRDRQRLEREMERYISSKSVAAHHKRSLPPPPPPPQSPPYSPLGLQASLHLR